MSLFSSNLRLIAALLGLVAAFALTACGDDDDEPAQTTEGTATADVGRYCELSEELDQAGSAAFERLEQDPDATQEDFAEAEADFVEGVESELDELTAVAPAEISEDVDVLVAAVRARGGVDVEAPPRKDAAEAESAIRSFEKENCG